MNIKTVLCGKVSIVSISGDRIRVSRVTEHTVWCTKDKLKNFLTEYAFRYITNIYF